MTIRRPHTAFRFILCASLAASATLAGAQTPRASGVYAPPTDETSEIVVTASRIGGDLFPGAAVPPTACLAAAPPLGAARPGFAIDGKTIKNAKALEKLRKKTRSGTIFVTGGDFGGARFSKAELTDICFFGTNFAKSDWRGFSGSGLGFVDSDLSGANLSGARMPFVLLRDAKLAGTDASGADFSNGRLDGGWGGSLKGLKLDRARLAGFRFECGTGEKDGCPVERDGLSMRGADLTKASLFPLALADAELGDAVIDQTEIGIDHLGALGTAKLNGSLVVRSRRRAAMFFPGEAKRLADALAAGGANVRTSGGERTCADTGAAIDRAICAIPGSEVAALVEDVATLDARAPRTRRATAERTRWLAGRDACLTRGDAQDECILGAYRTRRTALLGAGGRPGWLGETGPMLFVSDDIPASAAVAGSALFDRLRPIMLDAAQSVILLNLRSGGVIDAKGHTLGGCVVNARGLAFDRASGALELGSSGPAGAGADLLMVSGDRMRVLEGGLAAAANGAMVEQAYCRRGASFASMRRVRLDPATLTELWDQF